MAEGKGVTAEVLRLEIERKTARLAKLRANRVSEKVPVPASSSPLGGGNTYGSNVMNYDELDYPTQQWQNSMSYQRYQEEEEESDDDSEDMDFDETSTVVSDLTTPTVNPHYVVHQEEREALSSTLLKRLEEETGMDMDRHETPGENIDNQSSDQNKAHKQGNDVHQRGLEDVLEDIEREEEDYIMNAGESTAMKANHEASFKRLQTFTSNRDREETTKKMAASSTYRKSEMMAIHPSPEERPDPPAFHSFKDNEPHSKSQAKMPNCDRVSKNYSQSNQQHRREQHQPPPSQLLRSSSLTSRKSTTNMRTKDDPSRLINEKAKRSVEVDRHELHRDYGRSHSERLNRSSNFDTDSSTKYSRESREKKKGRFSRLFGGSSAKAKDNHGTGAEDIEMENMRIDDERNGGKMTAIRKENVPPTPPSNEAKAGSSAGSRKHHSDDTSRVSKKSNLSGSATQKKNTERNVTSDRHYTSGVIMARDRENENERKADGSKSSQVSDELEKITRARMIKRRIETLRKETDGAEKTRTRPREPKDAGRFDDIRKKLDNLQANLNGGFEAEVAAKHQKDSEGPMDIDRNIDHEVETLRKEMDGKGGANATTQQHKGLRPAVCDSECTIDNRKDENKDSENKMEELAPTRQNVRLPLSKLANIVNDESGEGHKVDVKDTNLHREGSARTPREVSSSYNARKQKVEELKKKLQESRDRLLASAAQFEKIADDRNMARARQSAKEKKSSHTTSSILAESRGKRKKRVSPKRRSNSKPALHTENNGKRPTSLPPDHGRTRMMEHRTTYESRQSSSRARSYRSDGSAEYRSTRGSLSRPGQNTSENRSARSRTILAESRERLAASRARMGQLTT
mmetsp:Transcript_31484/g.46087  ORF Transcript_31484/g.46087 Transcript_31484/m.46087 type:complete len:859 (+) Transcript_31484:216-2792(+)